MTVAYAMDVLCTGKAETGGDTGRYTCERLPSSCTAVLPDARAGVGSRLQCGHPYSSAVSSLTSRRASRVFQVVSLPEEFEEAHGLIERLRAEYVVAVTGTLRERSSPNPKVVRGRGGGSASRFPSLCCSLGSHICRNRDDVRQRLPTSDTTTLSLLLSV
jgi:hypothetical protein